MVLRMTGMPFGGQLGAGLGLDGRSQAAGLGQSCLHLGKFAGVHGFVGSESQGVPPRSCFGHSRRRAAFPVPGNGQEGLFHRGRRPPSGHHSQLDDDRQAPSGPPGGRCTRAWRAVMHCRASWTRSVIPQASNRSSPDSSPASAQTGCAEDGQG